MPSEKPVSLDITSETLEYGSASAGIGFTVYNQYGASANLTGSLMSEAAIAAADGVHFVSSDDSVVSGCTTDEEGDLILLLGGSPGTAVITAVINSTGSVSSITVEVNAASQPDQVLIDPPSDVVADGESITLDIAVLDQYGNDVAEDSALLDDLFTCTSGCKVTPNYDGTITVEVVEGDFTVMAGEDGAYGSVTLYVFLDGEMADVDARLIDLAGKTVKVVTANGIDGSIHIAD